MSSGKLPRYHPASRYMAGISFESGSAHYFRCWMVAQEELFINIHAAPGQEKGRGNSHIG